MKSSLTLVLATVLAYSTLVVAHGFVKSVNVDGSVYFGFNPDAKLNAKRVGFGFYAGPLNVDGTAAIPSANDLGLACNRGPTPPELIAEVRAGSNISFHWTKWLPSHAGPMTTYMAPYEGNVSNVNVNLLKFFKIHEAGLYPDGTWATDKMLANQGLWTVSIPYDIKPGTYVVRHELLSLHFATEDSNYKAFGVVGPQFYPSCYNIRVTGSGAAQPVGVTFPGAYKPMHPGLVFDIYLKNQNYPIPGPKVYRPAGAPPLLEPRPTVKMSPMGDPVKDEKYEKEAAQEIMMWETMTDGFQAAGG